MKVTEHFHVEELVHPKFIEEYGAEKMRFVLTKYAGPMLAGLEILHTFFDTYIIINDYKFGGNYENSGLRHHDYPLGAPLSAHYFMMATDCKIKGISIKDAQERILMSQHVHRNIVRMEDHRDTKTWLHIQWGYRFPEQSIEVFRP